MINNLSIIPTTDLEMTSNRPCGLTISDYQTIDWCSHCIFHHAAIGVG